MSYSAILWFNFFVVAISLFLAILLRWSNFFSGGREKKRKKILDK